MKASVLFKLLKADGWVEIRQTGSHVMMKHPVKDGQLVVPFHGSKEVSKDIVNAILKEAKIKTGKR
jgi:predicted RNA binding protein YcfA (HicA-like mRNA interferase family)